MKNLKPEILSYYVNYGSQLGRALNNFYDHYQYGQIPFKGDGRMVANSQTLMACISNVLPVLNKSQTVIFSTEQAEYFRQEDDTFLAHLSCESPFPKMFVQFTTPIPLWEGALLKNIIGFVYFVQTITEEDLANTKALLAVSDKMNIPMTGILKTVPGIPYVHVNFISQNFTPLSMTWSVEDKLPMEKAYTHEDRSQWLALRNMVLGCLGYMNCENIVLEEEGGTTEVINRKRESKGKTRLEPYYLCRVSGVQSAITQATGTGTQHGHRYDVRGHFRHYRRSGKTKWIPPHQRGLPHELYIPKTYVVTAGSKTLP